jgi:glycosyltransferase involved in cell wall biosynthesis
MNLAILGEGPYETSLHARAQALGIADRLTIQKWGAPTEVARFLQGLDVLVLLTRTSKRVVEQFGRVIVEAQSCGVPVIGSRGGAIPSVVGEGGWIVAERDPANLAELLDHLAADPTALRIKARLAEENVAGRFTYDIVAEDLAQSWFKAAEARGARSAAGSTSIVPGHA